MGGGSYSYINSVSRSSVYRTKSREEVFTQSAMSPQMDIVGKVRESRDSEEHPQSFPIIIALDITGSMNDIPEYLIKHAFPDIMKSVMDGGVVDPQVCFVGIGDHYSDRAPIQVGQFESSDELLDKWLKTLWLEGGGGGNGGESYSLAWYFATKHTSTDSFLKRGKKGVIISIGDESCHRSINSTTIKILFGDSLETDMVSKDILREAQKSWMVYHIHLGCGSGYDDIDAKAWKNLLGENLILEPLNSRRRLNVARDIPKIIISAYNSQRENTPLQVEDSKRDKHLR